MAKLFIQYFAAYEKPLILVSQAQNGTTSIVRHSMKNLQEHHAFSCVRLSISRATTSAIFQRRIEKNLIWKNSNHLTSVHQTQCLVFVDDLNLAKE